MHREGISYVIGCDEVGRGAIAGPVAVGLSAVGVGIGKHPAGLRDSKMLSEKRREELSPLARTWSHYSACRGSRPPSRSTRSGSSRPSPSPVVAPSPSCTRPGLAIHESVVLLDGSHDWLTPGLAKPPRVRTRVKADRDCASVAAASVIAKVHRDRLMIEADATFPGYGWSGNKGYGSASHFAALDALGPSELHRQTWLHERAG